MTSVPQLLNFSAVATAAAVGSKAGAQHGATDALAGQGGGELAGQEEERIDFGALLRDLVLEGMIPEEFKHPFTLQVPADAQQGSAEKATDAPVDSAGSQTTGMDASVTVEGNASELVSQAVPLTGALAELLQGALQEFSQLSAGTPNVSQAYDAQSVMQALAALTQAAGVKGQENAAVTEAVTSGETALPAQLVAMLRNARGGTTPQTSGMTAGSETPSSAAAPVATDIQNVTAANVSRETPATTAGVVVAKVEPSVGHKPALQGEVTPRQQVQTVAQPELVQRMTTNPVLTSGASLAPNDALKNPSATGTLVAGAAEAHAAQPPQSASVASGNTSGGTVSTSANSTPAFQPAAQPSGQVTLDSAQLAAPASSAAQSSQTASASSTAGGAQAAAGVNASSPAAPPAPVAAAHATSPATPTTPPAAVELARQVSAKFGALREMNAGTHQLSIKVTPEEFGPIRVVARIDGGSVGIDLHTASATGRELLKAAMADIRRDLPPNLAGATVNVADNGNGQSNSAQGGNANAGQQNASQGSSSFDGRGGSRGGEGSSAHSARDQQRAPGAEQETVRQVTGYEGGVDVLT